MTIEVTLVEKLEGLGQLYRDSETRIVSQLASANIGGAQVVQADR